MSRFSTFCENFFVSQCQKNSQVNPSLLCFRKIPVAKNFWIRGGGGVSIFSVENFLPNRAYNFRRGILSCCINFGYRKSMDKRGGSIKIFRGKKFVSQCRKNS